MNPITPHGAVIVNASYDYTQFQKASNSHGAKNVNWSGQSDDHPTAPTNTAARYMRRERETGERWRGFGPAAGRGGRRRRHHWLHCARVVSDDDAVPVCARARRREEK